MRLFFILLLCFFSVQAFAQNKGNIVIDLADDHVDITSGFTGAAVTVFGSADQDGDIAIVLRGPESRVAIRKKAPVFGMWVNRASVDFKQVPLFYAYSVSGQTHASDAAILSGNGIGIDALHFTADDYGDKASVPEFQEALIRTQQAKGFFPTVDSPMRFPGQRLFRTNFYLPSNVPIGRYEVAAYLFKDGHLIDTRAVDLQVAQAGLSADILNFAINHSFAYAILGLFMAGSAGILAFWMSRSQRA